MRPWQRFCSTACRNAYGQLHGTEGRIARVSRLKRGISVTLHFAGPAAERAMNLRIGDVVRIVRKAQ